MHAHPPGPAYHTTILRYILRLVLLAVLELVSSCHDPFVVSVTKGYWPAAVSSTRGPTRQQHRERPPLEAGRAELPAMAWLQALALQTSLQ